MDNYSFTYQEIINAFNDCIKSKKNTSNAMSFTCGQTEKLIELCDEVNDGTYQIGKSIAFVVKYPVYREVFAADFRDRIIHHLVIRELLPYFEEEFIDESFSCRVDKGVLYGVSKMYEYMDEATEHYTKDAWILKMDIKSFFMNINKKLLCKMVDELIVTHYPDNRKKEKLRWLCEMIIMHHPEKNCELRGDTSLWDKLPKGKSLFEVGETKGLPIGNLTSQIFANFYLNVLDKYIKETLGFKYYGRYVDDFVIISNDKEKLLKAVQPIINFAYETLGAVIHPNKRYCQYYKNGVRFIGGVIKVNRKYIFNRTKGSLFYKLTRKFPHYNKDKELDLMMCVNSYLGYMRQYSSYNLRKKLLTKSGLLDSWMPYINIDKNYRKILLKNNPDKLVFNDVMNQLPSTDG